MEVWQRLRDIVGTHGRAGLVTLADVKGSAPREAGARMVVRLDGAFHGTIGGGRLEWEALQAATRALAERPGPARFIEEALGPDLGQCCGGRVTVVIETFDPSDIAEIDALAAHEATGVFATSGQVEAGGRIRRAVVPMTGDTAELPWARLGRAAASGCLALDEVFGDLRTPLLLFGAGHVGRAVVLALAPLPFRLRWIDPRAEAFPRHVPAHVETIRAADPPAEIAMAPAGAFVLVMTHDHPLDLAVVAAALRRPDLPFVGLIGSATKRARFRKRLQAAGLPGEALARFVCPIGIGGITGKEPAVIAASAVAQLLQVKERVQTAKLSQNRSIRETAA